MSNRFFKASLLATTVIAGMAIASPAYAQDATNQPGPATCPPGSPEPCTQTSSPEDTSGAPDPGSAQPQVPIQNTNDQTDQGDEIVVTGTLIPRRTTAETPSPVTVMSAESLAQRGLNTVSEAVQRISANNAGTIQAGWNTGFNFASGANAPSLRGLTVQSTLSIFDGLRMAPYPLADDGQRNFVDLNTVPNAIIDRIEVLRDGASSTYGADAIAGVINVITKKEIQGLHLNGSYGISQEGDAEEQRADITFGHGDLDSQGFNFYVSGEYQNQEELWARDRGYPFNTADESRICGESNGLGSVPEGTETCLHDGRWNAVSDDGFFNGFISVPGVTFVRPATAGNASGSGRFQYLNPAAGCRGFEEQTILPTQSGTSPLTTCIVDWRREFIMLQPDIERMGFSGRATVNVTDQHQIYAMANYFRTVTFASFTPLGFNGTPTPPTGGALVYNVMQPIYVCPTGVGTRTGTNTGCTATTPGAMLNPYNPFAANGQTAQTFLRSTRPRTIETNTRALRGALGASGTFLDAFNYNAEFTASEVRLRRDQAGYLIPQRIMNAVARGQFNFADPEATPEEVWDYISPTNRTISTSQLWQASGTISRALFALPGGDLAAAVGAQYREESINAPSGNPAVDPISGNPYERYYSVNSVGTQGSRNVKSAFFEVNAPIVDQFELVGSGRYDKYSTGQDNFSPKIGAKFTPVREVAVRGTWSKGFRIPSFNEAFGLPTTGYVTRGGSAFCTTYAAFCAAHGSNSYATTSFPLGLTQTGNPGLDPEKSTSFTAGLIFEPVRNVSFTFDFWDIEIKDLVIGVTPAQQQEAFDQYYRNNGVVNVPGITVLPGVPDPAFPNALPHIGFIQSSFQNANSQNVRGVDLGGTVRIPLTAGIQLSSSAEASYLMKYEFTEDTDAGAVKTRYEGTLSPCNITSCSGAPKWRASWQNTLDFGNTTVSGTVYYTSPMSLVSTDFGATKGDCFSGIPFGSVVTYSDGATPVMCNSKAVWNVDLTGSHKFSDRLTIYANVLNVLDIDAPYDPSAAYHIFNFNPAWAGPNIMGRYFRLGAKVSF